MSELKEYEVLLSKIPLYLAKGVGERSDVLVNATDFDYEHYEIFMSREERIPECMYDHKKFNTKTDSSIIVDEQYNPLKTTLSDILYGEKLCFAVDNNDYIIVGTEESFEKRKQRHLDHIGYKRPAVTIRDLSEEETEEVVKRLKKRLKILAQTDFDKVVDNGYCNYTIYGYYPYFSGGIDGKGGEGGLIAASCGPDGDYDATVRYFFSDNSDYSSLNLLTILCQPKCYLGKYGRALLNFDELQVPKSDLYKELVDKKLAEHNIKTTKPLTADL